MARTRIPHQLRVPAPDRLEHDADEAWRRGPLAALAELGRPDAAAVAVTAMVPSLTAVDDEGRPLTPGLLYGDSRGGDRRAPTPRSSPVRRSNSCAGRRARRPTPRGTGPRRRWPTTRWRARRFSTLPPRARRIRCSTAPAGARTSARSAARQPTACPGSSRPAPRSGQLRDADAVLAAGSVDALCEQLVAGADRDGDVVVLCGTTLIVWMTIPEYREVPGLWTAAAHHGGKVSDRRAEQRRWAVPRLGESPCGRGQLDSRSRTGAGVVAVRARRAHAVPRPGSPGGSRRPGPHPRRRLGAAGRLRSVGLRRASAHRAERRTRRPHRGNRWRHPRAAMDAGDRRCHRSARRRVGRAGGGGAWERRSSAGWRPASKRQRPTPPGGRQRNASSNPTLRGPTRSRTATPDSSSWPGTVNHDGRHFR